MTSPSPHPAAPPPKQSNPDSCTNRIDIFDKASEPTFFPTSSTLDSAMHYCRASYGYEEDEYAMFGLKQGPSITDRPLDTHTTPSFRVNTKEAQKISHKHWVLPTGVQEQTLEPLLICRDGRECVREQWTFSLPLASTHKDVSLRAQEPNANSYLQANPISAILAVLAMVLWLGAYTYLHNSPNKKEEEEEATRQPQTLKEHRGVIEYTPPGSSRIRGDKEQQATRTRPNKRLEVIFGISNAFTTTDLEVKKKFVHAANAKMQSALGISSRSSSSREGDWTEIKQIARDAARQYLAQPQHRESFKIVELARVVTLKVSLRFLFGVSDEVLNAEGTTSKLVFIGQKINDLWIASKGSDTTDRPLPSWHSETNRELHEALSAVCDVPEVLVLRRETNPMNWLLPAYETMWRAVLACVIELCFRGAEPQDGAAAWLKALEAFLDDTTSATFGAPPPPPPAPLSSSEDATSSPGPQNQKPCASDIAKETLRLYPPTRHVYRRFTDAGPDVKADIEACQHNTADEGFGPTALRFRPERWVEIRAQAAASGARKTAKQIEEARGFMPFAIFCPAGKASTQEFGLKMVALLAGVLCECLCGVEEEGKGEWEIDGEGFGDLERPLPSHRAAFDELRLVRKRGD